MCVKLLDQLPRLNSYNEIKTHVKLSSGGFLLKQSEALTQTRSKRAWYARQISQKEAVFVWVQLECESVVA